jgi:SDR family mycofactocin-dependent oxidoreductase
MGLLDGRVGFVTGAARGQGRNHALRLAQEGAAVIAVDVADAVSPDNTYPPATRDDLDETARQLQAGGHRFLTARADVRDGEELDKVVAEGFDRFGGRLDVVVANAGICNWGRFWELSESQWSTLIDINLSGIWRTLKAAAPLMISAGNGGSIITVSSVAGIKALPGLAHYSAAKHGVTGLTNSAALELGEYGIRVNSIHPHAVATPMGYDPQTAKLLDAHPHYSMSFGSALADITMLEPDDVSDAVVWLASDRSRTVTGTQLTLDLGATKI